MPTSHPYQLNEIIWAIIESKPKSILDIGIGFGKYGFLSREYLDILSGRYDKWQIEIEGIEGFEKYITPVHKFIYNKIHIGNALEVINKLEKTYDLILLIDVLEHFEYSEGIQLLNRCSEKAKNILVSLPKIMAQQGESFENPLEIHKFAYKKKHFDQFKNKCIIPHEHSLIIYIGENSKKLNKEIMKQNIKKYIPFLVYSYMVIKRLSKSLFRRRH
ncbi:MAG: hypothetical protein JW871_06125 [Endomicrobiales bacterium]|nr:hypothetical protein [Endomicrobiales bacterium]